MSEQLSPAPSDGQALKDARPYTEPGSMSFLACHLCRSFSAQPWGLWISLIDRNSLIVGSVQPKSFESLVHWSWVTQSVPDTTIICNTAFGSDLWRSYFCTLPLNLASPREFLPGDKILSINGYAISAFMDFAQIIAYLKQCTQLFIVAIRSNTAALEALLGGLDKQALSENAHRIFQQIALEANWPHPMRTVTPLHSPSFVAYSSPLSTQLINNVAPLESEFVKRQLFSGILQVSGHRERSTPQSIHSKSHTTITHSMKMSDKPLFLPKGEAKGHLKDSSVNCSLTAIQQQCVYKNPMFKTKPKNGDHPHGEPVPYVDNNFFDPYEGTRRKQFLTEINCSSFYRWLGNRKKQWRSRWKIISRETLSDPTVNFPAVWTNPMFYLYTQNKNGPNHKVPILYGDSFQFDPEDGNRSSQFLVPVNSVKWSDWFYQHKEKWRSHYKVHRIEGPSEDDDPDYFSERKECSVPFEFWIDRYPSFEYWLSASLSKWKSSYSWNQRKRKRIQEECEEVVHFPSSSDSKQAHAEFLSWIRIRRNQWRVLRRKRQRQLKEALCASTVDGVSKSQCYGSDAPETGTLSLGYVSGKQKHGKHGVVSGDWVCIDALLEEEERRKKCLEDRKPIDISFLFYPSNGCPDDVAAHILEFLDTMEHPKLLSVSKMTADGLRLRSCMWQQLCPSYWSLPRRPRKPWYEIYLSKLRMETISSRKQWDDLIGKISDVLLRGDQLSVVKNLVGDAETKFAFDINYVSGVVCERNSILNLAVIHQRHKIVHWLVTEKKADIETSDRGFFTPLLNAAWGGDKHLVRLLLQHGADRSKVGTGHYTEALAPSDFQGFNAENWARKKGFDDIAELIRIGL